jgi:hypothetical protein
VGYLYVRDEADGALLIDRRVLIVDGILLVAAAIAVARQVFRTRRRRRRSPKATEPQRLNR